MGRVSNTFKIRQHIKNLFGRIDVLRGRNHNYIKLIQQHGHTHPDYGTWNNELVGNNYEIENNRKIIQDLKIKHGISESFLNEKSPPGWEGTVKAMKKHGEISNPWALAWWMKHKGYKSHKKLKEEIGYDEMPKKNKIDFHFRLMNLFKKRSIESQKKGDKEGYEFHKNESDYHWKKAMRMTRGYID